MTRHRRLGRDVVSGHEPHVPELVLELAELLADRAFSGEVYTYLCLSRRARMAYSATTVLPALVWAATRTTRGAPSPPRTRWTCDSNVRLGDCGIVRARRGRGGRDARARDVRTHPWPAPEAGCACRTQTAPGPGGGGEVGSEEEGGDDRAARRRRRRRARDAVGGGGGVGASADAAGAARPRRARGPERGGRPRAGPARRGGMGEARAREWARGERRAAQADAKTIRAKVPGRAESWRATAEVKCRTRGGFEPGAGAADERRP